MRRAQGLVSALVGLAVALAACGGDDDDTAPTTAAPTTGVSTTAPSTAPPTPATSLANVSIALTEIAAVDTPTAMAVRGGDPSLYIAEQAGRVRRIRVTEDSNDRKRYALERTPVLDIVEDVTSGGEQGLLGITFSPDGRRLYVAYTADGGDEQQVDEFAMEGDRVDTGSRRPVFEIPDFAPNHNGGNILFGPDGFLYYGMGDGGGGGDPEETGQDPSDLLGALLRVDPEGGEPYGIPGGNPFADGSGGAPEVFAYGLRNPWRFSFDRETGDLWIGDVGQNELEEIDFLPSGVAAGANLGWNLFEGTRPFESDEPPEGHVGPLLEYPTSDGCAVIGGYVYRGDAVPGLAGTYLYSDACNGVVRGLIQSGGAVTETKDFGVAVENPSSFGEDGDGELFLLSLAGPIYRIDPG